MSVAGLVATKQAFEDLSVASRRRVMRPALAKAIKIVLKAAKADIPPGTFEDSSGATRRSLGSKIGLGKHGVFAVAGARIGVGGRMHKGRWREPARYLHLINKWLPFIEASLDEHVGEIESTIRRETKIALEKEVRKIAAKAAAKMRRAA